ncbi:MAG: sulfatase-like hydrolase/transferase [Halioglobus sp.]
MVRTLLQFFVALFLSAFVSKAVFIWLAPSSALPIFSSGGLFSLLWGVRMDLAAVAIVSIPVVVATIASYTLKLQSTLFLKMLTVIAASWLIMCTMADAIYTQEAGTHITYELFTARGSEVGLLLTAINSHLVMVLTALGLVLIAAFFIMKLPLENIATQMPRKRVTLVTVIVWVFLAVSCVRGGWWDAPQSPMTTYKIGDSEMAFLAWSAPYSITYYLAKGPSQAARRLTPDPSADLLAQWESGIVGGTSSPVNPLKTANVVMVLLESWAAVDMQGYANQVDGTPFFDGLRENSFTTHAMYATGHRTVQGVFSTMCSFPNPVGGIVAGNQLQSHQYRCLPQMLKEQGWQTSFIQGSGKAIVGRFAQSLGFTHSFGKKDYPFDDVMNSWGYMDDGIYRFSLDEIRKMQSVENGAPFFVTINTGSTHDIELPAGNHYKFGDDNRDNIRRSLVNHADQALARFIKALTEELKDPTLVVLISDHTARVPYDGIARYSLPFLMFATDGSIPVKKLAASASQRDIAPTILHWLGAQVPWFMGQSLLSENYKSRTSFFSEETVSWIEGNRLLYINASSSELEGCFIIAPDTVTLAEESCRQPWVDSLYQEAIMYTDFTQYLLFRGQSLHYRDPMTFTTSGANE